MKDTFPLCPPRTIQVRPVSDCSGASRLLWRTDQCHPDRWHYIENPCKCGAWREPFGSSLPFSFFAGIGYNVETVKPETGTWRRDAQYIASRTHAFREQLRQRRDAETAARAAAGPQGAMHEVHLQCGWCGQVHMHYCAVQP